MDYGTLRFAWRSANQSPSERMLVGTWPSSEQGTQFPQITVVGSDGLTPAEVLTVKMVGSQKDLAALRDSALLEVGYSYLSGTIIDGVPVDRQELFVPVNFYAPTPGPEIHSDVLRIPVHFAQGAVKRGDGEIGSSKGKDLEFYCTTNNLRFDGQVATINFDYGLIELGGNNSWIACEGDFAGTIPAGRIVKTIGEGAGHANWHYRHTGEQGGWCGPEGASLGSHQGFQGSYVKDPYPKGDGPDRDDHGHVRIDCFIEIPYTYTTEAEVPAKLKRVR